MIREDRLALRFLGAGSIAINLGLLAMLGVQHGNDTVRYIASAAEMLAGQPFRGQNGWLYIGYNGLLAATEATGAGQLGVIGFQFAVAACATLALYDLGRQVGGRLAGLIAATVFVIDYDIARWHLYVLTDSLYISLVAIATWAVHRAAERRGRAYALAAMVLMAIALVRPNGWLMIPVAAIYWIARSDLGRTAKRAMVVGIVLACVGGGAAVAIVQFGRLPPSRPGPRRPTGEIKPLPFAPAMTLRGRLNPVQIPKRIGTELLHVHRSFSLKHKLMVFAMLAVVYPLAVWGFLRSRGQPLARLMLGIVVAHLVLVGITFSDRDGRYLLYVFPLMLVFAASAAAALGQGRGRR